VGVKPGNQGSWFQNVPAVAIKLDGARSSFRFDTTQGAVNPKFPDKKNATEVADGIHPKDPAAEPYLIRTD